MDNTKNELNTIVEWLNRHYNQDSDEYDIFFGSKPGVVRYNDHTAISLWSCGAIVCIYDQLFFICEDDGYWWINEEEKDRGRYAYQDSFSIGWTESFVKALTDLKTYVWENGTPVCYSGTNTVCHYRLDKESN